MTGPFTTLLLMIALALGTGLIFLTPFVMLYLHYFVKDEYGDNLEDLSLVAVWIWAVMSLAFVLDGVWHLIKGVM